MNTPPLILPSLPHISASILLNKPLIMLILLLFFVVYSIISYILLYHWKAYGMKSRGIIIAEVLFFSVSIVLFIISGLAINYF